MKISLFCNDVTVLDYAYLDDHRGVVGDSLKVDVNFIGETDNEGVLYDFSYAKKKVKEVIDRDCDHRLVVPLGATEQVSDHVEMRFKYGICDHEIFYQAPEQAFCQLPSAVVNKASITEYLQDRIMRELPDNVLSVELTLREECLGERPIFHYTHGLKDHYGNCQRLFHGHRNSIDIYVNGQRREDLESTIVYDLLGGNIHFCFLDNIVNQEEVVAGLKNNEGRAGEGVSVKIRYTSNQGQFYGELPGREVYVLEDESTVENLSQYFAAWVKQQVRPQDRVVVRAYEGIGKGAMTTL